MKYLALLSGGKDSCYNLLHCAKNGHELIAAASLGPEQGKEELDSYLYQTVGQDAIEFVARALDVPLYRRVITGAAVEQGSEYGDRAARGADGVLGDETEDLYKLLTTVKSHHPDVQGVSVGAILSNYQRVRVEHVCHRLGLTPLCYLWQRDQGELLSEMISAGMEAVLIKVAGIGLTTKHLGKTLMDMRPTLIKLNDLYGSHICGEGGEYESLTLDCPLFKSRIVLTEVETVIHSDSDFATVAFLRIKNAALEPKEVVAATDVSVPELLDAQFISLCDAVRQVEADTIPEAPKAVDRLHCGDTGALVEQIGDSKVLGPWVSISNIERILHGAAQDISIEDEVTECFSILKERLAQHGLNISNCTNINIFLSSIDIFARVNAIYSTFFGSSPPARACVAVDLPHPVRVRLDCTAFAEVKPTDRQALHVQGLSYWAPANIGPYSQAITAGERIFISGQIGLIPSSLTLPSPPSLATEAALACQHVTRVTEALRSNSGGGWVGHTQAVLYWLGDTNYLARTRDALRQSEARDAPTLFLVVKELPKNAMIEKQVLLHTGRCEIKDEEDDDVSLQPCEPKFEQHSVNFPSGAALRWELSHFDHSTSSCIIVCGRGGDDTSVQNTLKTAHTLHSFAKSGLSVRLFYVPSRVTSISHVYGSIFGHGINPPTTQIPCRNIATMDSDHWDYALCIVGA